MSEHDLARVDARLRELLMGEGAALEASYYCTHATGDRCGCRKPEPGLILRAAAERGIDLTRSWMLGDSLTDIEAAVTVIDDLSTGQASRVNAGAELQRVDIPDVDTLRAIFDRMRPEAVLHLGAQPMATVSVNDPARDCEVNLRGTLSVLTAAARHDAPVVFTSTGGALYGDDVPLPTPETQIPAPLSPYGASKWAGEAYVRTLALADGLPHAVCRLGNMYGPRQSPHGEARVVSIVSRLLWEGPAPTLFGFGKATRDDVNVADVVRCLRAASSVAGVFNVATAIETSVLELFEVLRDVAGSQLEPTLAPLREGELTRSCMDSSHAPDVLGWSAEVLLAQGAHATDEQLVEEFAAEVPSCR
jgi:UDP-glucose 4-epimerase